MILSQKELRRIKVIENAVQGRLSQAKQPSCCSLCERQVKRLKSQYDTADPEWVHHGNHGREPTNALPYLLRQQ